MPNKYEVLELTSGMTPESMKEILDAIVGTSEGRSIIVIDIDNSQDTAKVYCNSSVMNLFMAAGVCLKLFDHSSSNIPGLHDMHKRVFGWVKDSIKTCEQLAAYMADMIRSARERMVN